MKGTCRVLLFGMGLCAMGLAFASVATALAKETVLHAFGSGTDGQSPEAGLVDVKGILYGTTYLGGAKNSGAVFAIDPKTGAEAVLYAFCSRQKCADGAYPQAGLIDVKGTLYGATQDGGVNDGGTVFSFDPATGKEKVLYSFCQTGGFSCTDGRYPLSSLIDMNGTLLGTTERGGVTGCRTACGTVFSVDPKTRTEKVLYRFCGQPNCADGDDPLASLIAVNGTLYGITADGGANCPSFGCGTVFALDPTTGSEKVLYSFCSQANCADGAYPQGGLIDVNGTLYGTTAEGGVFGCSGGTSCGTVFSIDPNSGAEKVLQAFRQAGGNFPFAPLIDVKGSLYGTTYNGGVTDCDSLGCGTAFSIDPDTGAEKVLYRFCSRQDCTDGQYPEGALIDVNGTLYGTSQYGGTYGNGTVFALKKP